jgi:hypothetical protein
MTFVFALLGAKALWLTYIWLGSTICASWLSGRKGYGERMGLATGLLLSLLGLIIWLLVPARADSPWKRNGAFGRKGTGPSTLEDPPPGERPVGHI